MPRLIVITTCIILSSCGGGHVAKLPLPAELVLPRIPASDLECLSDDTSHALAKRDRLQTQRRETLRNIIKTTHGLEK